MGFGEMLVLFLLAFLLLGPKKAPEFARQVLGAVAKAKRTSSDLSAQLTLEAVNLPPEIRSDTAIDARRQTIVGELPPATFTSAKDATCV
jgi:Sec-independent protein translocase protein TatA